MHILHVQLMFAFLLNTEMVKNFLTFILQNVDPKTPLGRLLKELLKEKNGKLTKPIIENEKAKKIAKRIDVDLRNSLAHFTFREDGALIRYYDHCRKDKNWILNESQITSSDLLAKVQEHSLIRAILGSMIVDWYGL